MKRIKVLYILLCLLAIVDVSCRNKHDETQYKTLNFDKYLSYFKTDSIDSLSVDFRDIAKFKWKELYIFKPYTTISLMDSVLGFRWEDAKHTLIDQSDEFNLLLFADSNKIKYYSKVPRHNVDFIKLHTNGPYYWNSTVFTLRKEKFGQEEWLFFYKGNR